MLVPREVLHSAVKVHVSITLRDQFVHVPQRQRRVPVTAADAQVPAFVRVPGQCLKPPKLFNIYIYILLLFARSSIFRKEFAYQNGLAVIDIHVGDQIRPEKYTDIPVQGMMRGGGDVSIIGGKFEQQNLRDVGVIVLDDVAVFHRMDRDHSHASAANDTRRNESLQLGPLLENSV